MVAVTKYERNHPTNQLSRAPLKEHGKAAYSLQASASIFHLQTQGPSPIKYKEKLLIYQKEYFLQKINPHCVHMGKTSGKTKSPIKPLYNSTTFCHRFHHPG